MADVTIAQAKLRAIEALMKAEKPMGKLEIAHAAEVPLGNIKSALEELIDLGIIEEKRDKYDINIEGRDAEFAVVTEIVLATLELLGPLPPRDLAECVIDILGEDYGPGKIQGIASAVAGSKKTQLRRRSVGGGGASKWGRDFYYLLKQTDELGPRLRMYESSKLRKQWRQRIKAATADVITEEEWADIAPAGEGPEEPFETIDGFIDHLKGCPQYDKQIMHIQQLDSQGATHGTHGGCVNVYMAPMCSTAARSLITIALCGNLHRRICRSAEFAPPGRRLSRRSV